MWFVVHVKPGTEAQAVELLKSTTKSDGLEEVFSPMAECVHSENGELVVSREPMLDGCVFAVAPSKWELRACLRRAAGLEGLITDHPSYDAMENREAEFINALVEPDEHIVEMSEAVVDEDGWMTIAAGPLLGREGEILKRTERRRWAYLETRIAGKPTMARLGLRVTRNDRGVSPRAAKEG